MRIGIVALLAVVIGAWVGWGLGRLEERGKDADIADLKAQILALTEEGGSRNAQLEALEAEAAARKAAPEANLKQNSDPASVFIRYANLVDDILAYRSSFEADDNKPEKVAELERRAGELRTFLKRWRSGMPSLCGLFGTDNDALEAEPTGQDKAPLFATITQLHDKIAATQAKLEQTLRQSQGTQLAATAVSCPQPGAWVTKQEAWKPL